MCTGFPNCPEGQKQAGKTNFFLPYLSISATIFFLVFSIFTIRFQCSFTLDDNVPAIPAVADLRAANLSAATKAHA
jgi:hypothetical protein